MKFKKSLIALNISSLLFCNYLYAAPIVAAASGSQKTPVNQSKPAAHPHSAEQMTAASRHAMRHNTARHQAVTEGSDSVTSDAFNYKSLYGADVDPRTGMYGFHYTLGTLIGNDGIGPNLSLTLSYNQNSQVDLYGIAPGWGLNLSHYNNDSQTLTLSTGASYRITNITDTGKMDLQYAKLDNLHVYKGESSDPYFLKLVYKDGHIEYLNNQGYLTEIESARGDKLTIKYDDSHGKPEITQIVDESGKHHIDFKYQGGGIVVQSQDESGGTISSTLEVSNSLLTGIQTPIAGQSMQFHYKNYGTQHLIDQVDYPTGGSDQLIYTALQGPDISGHNFVEYAVSQRTLDPGFDLKSITTNYDYNSVDQHNYLGHGQTVPYQPNVDLLFETDANYQYATRVTTGQKTMTYTYNKYHLLMDKSVEIEGQSTNARDQKFCYPVGDGQQVCGNDPVTETIQSLPENYTLQTENQLTFYRPPSAQSLLGANQARARTVSTHQSYDNQGNLISSQDVSGMQVHYDYLPADGNGFQNYKQAVTLSPAVSSANGDTPPAQLSEHFQYQQLDPVDKSLKAKLYLVKQIDSQYQGADQKWQTFRSKVSQYYQQSGQANYGRLAQMTVALPKSQQLKGSEGLSNQSQAYQYQSNTVQLNGKSYPVLKTTVQQGGASANGLRGAAPVTAVQYKSAYTGKTILQEDSQGNKTGFVYDAMGRKVAEIANVGSAMQATKKYQYIQGPTQNALIETAPNGYQSRVLYDGLGRVIEKDAQHIDPSSGKAIEGQWDKASSVTYDTYGNKASETAYDTDGSGNPLMLTTHYQYDDENRLTVTSYPDGAATVTAYDDVGNRAITYMLASNGKAISNKSSPCRIGDKYYGCEIRNFSVVEKDNAGKVIANYLIASNPEGKSADGQPLYSGAIKSGLTDQESYLANGLAFEPSWLSNWIETVIQQKAYYSKSSKTYDGYNRVVVSTDIDGNQTHYHYDQKGDLIEKTLPGGQSQKMGYDMLGKLTQIGAMVGDQEKVLGTRYYNQLGELMWEKNPKGDTRSYQYDENGNPVQITTPNGDIIKQTYDEMNKLVKREVQGQPQYTATWTYDKATGQALTMQDATGTTHYSYYPDGKLKNVSHDGTGALAKHGVPAYTLSYTYTLAGKPKSITDAAGHVTQYTYNALGQLAKITYDGKPVEYHYDTYGRLVTKDFNQGAQAKYQYGDYNRLSHLQYFDSASDKKQITGFAYQYQKNGNLIERVRTNQAGKTAQEQYQYDKDNNLSHYSCSGDLCPRDQLGNIIQSQQYHFDALNNIALINSVMSTSKGQSEKNMTTYRYDQTIPTRLLGYKNSNSAYGQSQNLQYDADGNITHDDQGNTLAYSPFDRTLSVSMKKGQVQYAYDGAGSQVSETAANQPTQYFVYSQDQLLNTQQNAQWTSFFYGLNREGQQTGSNAPGFYLIDQGGSVIHIIGYDAKGQLVVQQENVYSPYGIETDLTAQKFHAASNTLAQFGFDGQLTDQQTDWQFLGKGYRAYNPLLHRFMSEDSLSPFDKGGVNGYLFSSNNPIMMYDPSGHVSTNFWYMLGGVGGGLLTIILSGGLLTAGGITSIAAGIGVAAAAGGIGTSVASYALSESNNISDRKAAKTVGYVGIGLDVVSILALGIGAWKLPEAIAGKTAQLEAKLGSSVGAFEEASFSSGTGQARRLFQDDIYQGLKSGNRSTYEFNEYEWVSLPKTKATAQEYLAMKEANEKLADMGKFNRLFSGSPTVGMKARGIVTGLGLLGAAGAGGVGYSTGAFAMPKQHVTPPGPPQPPAPPQPAPPPSVGNMATAPMASPVAQIISQSNQIRSN